MKTVQGISLCCGLVLAVLVADVGHAAQYLEPTNPQRSYGAGVVTKGGRSVWLAGMGGTRAPDGNKVTDFAGQTRQAFRNIEAALKRGGGTLENPGAMPVKTPQQSD